MTVVYRKTTRACPFDLLDADSMTSRLNRAQKKVVSFLGRQPHHDPKHFVALYWQQAA
jgi:hypothetical protein